MQDKTEKKLYGRLLVLLAILALIVAYLVLSYKSGDAQAADDKDETVTLAVVPLKTQKVTITKPYIGYVTPIHSVEMRPYINGFLEDIMVEGGQEVKAGDTLIVIRQEEYKAQMDAAKATQMQAEANFNNSKVFYQRMKAAGAKAISKTELDNAKASYLSYQAQVAQSRANYNLAKVNYDYTVIQAPINGVVGHVGLTRGDYVSPGMTQPLLTVIQFDPIKVVFSISDKDYLDEQARNNGNLFAGERIRLKLSNGKMYEKDGVFKYTDNAVNRSTNSIAVYAEFENEDRTLVANAYVDVLLEKDYPEGILVKKSRVSLTPEGNFIYIVRDNKLQKLKTEIIASEGENYLLQNVFKPGDLLVTDNASKIRPGQKIKIRQIQDTTATGKK